MPAPSHPVVVVGGGLAGMAAAARLAKAGRPVRLFEREAALGGGWRALQQPGVGLVDGAPAVLAFPAPWRDLFRKSGRPLEAELARSGHELVPAAPVRYQFADGSELTLPTDRGAQYATLSAAYGEDAAARWRDLLDALDNVWQVLRPLGLEHELTSRHQLSRSVRSRLWSRHSLAWVAARLGEPHLTALIRSLAHRHGSVPERTPAWVAVDAAVSRTFGHWQIRSSEPARHRSDDGRSSVLAEALAARLALRRVAVQLSSPVRALELDGGRVVGVRTDDGVQAAAAVIVTADPWHLVGDLLPDTAGGSLRRRVRRLRPAGAPALSHAWLDEPCAEVSETVELSSAGVPVVSYRRPGTTGTVVSRHDFGRPMPAPGAGVAWHGFRRWLDQPSVTSGVPGLYTAGPASPAGNGPSQVVLSGALASYACQDGAG
jgi:phytoene dehydrogenase-like protein